MNMNARATALTCVCCLLPAFSTLAVGGEERRPNVLVILADDLGYGELSCQGNPQIPTPRIDSIAKGGIRFTSGYVSGPYCSPTRAGLMLGRYQQRSGHEFNPGPANQSPEVFGLTRDLPTLAERFKAAGYATGMFGKWHLGYRPEFTPTRRGFDTFFGITAGGADYVSHRYEGKDVLFENTTPVKEEGYLTDLITRHAVDYITKTNAPFFVSLQYTAPHWPCVPSDCRCSRRTSRMRQPRLTSAKCPSRCW